MSDTPITDSLSFANLDDVETCKELERKLAAAEAALATARELFREARKSLQCHARHETKDLRNRMNIVIKRALKGKP